MISNNVDPLNSTQFKNTIYFSTYNNWETTQYTIHNKKMIKCNVRAPPCDPTRRNIGSTLLSLLN